MRADVNLSVREVGASEFGTRTEMKNLNSFKAITHAIEGERQRQIELIEEGKKVIQETRRWDDNKEYSYECVQMDRRLSLFPGTEYGDDPDMRNGTKDQNQLPGS